MASFDLDALIAEAAAEPFTFLFGGEEYVCPPTIDIRAVSALAAGDLVGALRIMVGDDQWARLEASPQTLGVAAIGKLIEAYAEHQGVSVGESSGSSSSSPSTEEPWKPTSRVTHKRG